MPLWRLGHHLRVCGDAYTQHATTMREAGLGEVGDHFIGLSEECQMWASLLESLAYVEEARKYVRVRENSLYVREHEEEDEE